MNRAVLSGVSQHFVGKHRKKISEKQTFFRFILPSQHLPIMMLKSNDDTEKKTLKSSQKSITLRDDKKKKILIKKSPFEFFTPRMRPRPSHFRKNLQGRNLDDSNHRIDVIGNPRLFHEFLSI